VIVTMRSSDAIDIVGQTPVDVVVCEIQAQPIPGAEFAGSLASRTPAIPVLLLGDREDESLLVAALRSGATGFFTKDAPVEEFLEGVEAVSRGQYTLGRTLVQPVLAKLTDRGAIERPDSLPSLSPSEQEILKMLGQAQSIATIATTRGISKKTVRNHIAHIYRKLGLRSRTEVVLWAARMGLVQPQTS
jgi:DNA-binding NarL/FixJ family response regulator